MLAAKDELFTRPSGGYTIARSVRLRSSATAYLNRTPSSSTNRRISTFSVWVKWSLTGSSAFPEIFSAAPNGLLYKDALYFSNNTLAVIFNGGVLYSLVTTQVFRDPSAWYHFVMAIDTTQATASNRVKLYVNGLQITAFGTANYPTQNYDPNFNSAIVHNIGRSTDANDYYDGYLTEINFIDGQALTPSSFGETDSITGVWKPKAYSGTYGTNGFELNFSDNSNNTAATIGKDYSGNGNNWTPNNISVTSGVTYDSMVDSPTVGATSSNYCVMNPLNKTYSTYTLSDGNLNWTSSTINMGSHGTFQLPTSGKYYWEIVMTANAGGSPAIGIADGLDSLGNKGIEYRTSGNKEQNGGVSGNGSGAYGATWTTNDVIGVAYDADTSSGQITFYKNNSSQGVAYSSIQTNFPNGLFPSFQNNAAGTTTFQANFGQRPFSYTPPTGFVALNTYNLPASTITNGAGYMAATTYTGNGTSQSVANTVGSTSFQPDFVWIKLRNQAGDYHNLFDSVRGATKRLFSNDPGAENTNNQTLTAFNSNGFSVGTNGNVNTNAINIIGWQWKAGTTSASNTNGSITSTVSVGATQGFSVVTYTGTGTTGTVGHGLGVAPSMMIFKSRSLVGSDWDVYHVSTGNTGRLFLNTTAAFQTVDVWNNTSPTSTVFTINGSRSDVNQNTDTYVAYCFAAVAGYSAFGSYTGNGSADGPFVYTGFRPRFVMGKASSGTNASTSNWFMMDSARNTYNVANLRLFANLSNADNTQDILDFTSNGFKLRTTNTSENTSGTTYIYMAFAENPFKNALAR